MPEDHLGELILYFFLIPGTIFAMASYVAWRERRSERVRGKGWTTMASLLNVLMPVVPLLGDFLRVGRSWKTTLILGIPVVFGIIGLLAFEGRREDRASMEKTGR